MKTSTTNTLTLLALLSGACTIDHALDVPPPPTPLAIAARAPIDVLFVVDNSTSMLEEQQTLLRSVFDDRCPITNLRDVPPEYASAPIDLLQELSGVCGIAQLVAAIDGDFHIGVITTDVGVCDERFSPAQDPDDVHTPTMMRGCLQGGVSGADGRPKFLTRDDELNVALQQAMLQVGTYGSPVERGMDAMRTFLDPESRRAPGCEDDLDGFLRKDGQLVVVFVSDEDDCSHADGAYGFFDEFQGEPDTCGEFFDLFNADRAAGRCYSDAEHLAPVSDYADFLRGLKDEGRTTDVFVGVVGGLVDSAGSFVPSGCSPDGDGGVSAVCQASFGASNSCDADENCCFADGAYRYAALASAVNSESLLGSICAPDFRAPLLPLFFQSDLSQLEAPPPPQ